MKRGIHAVQIPSEPMLGQSGAMIPCYIGNSPYWQIVDDDWQTKAGKAFLIEDFADFKAKLGYFEPLSGAWSKEHSLCEAAAAHFRWAITPVGPIICILNATTLDCENSSKKATVTFIGGRAVLKAEGLIVLSTVSIKDKVTGVDYQAFYDDSGNDIILKDLTGTLSGAVEVTFKNVTIPTSLPFSADTFDALETVDQAILRHPCLIAAPGWEDEPAGSTTVGKLLQAKASGTVNNHWYIQAYVQLNADRLSEVVAAKTLSGYDSHKTKVCWPYTMKDGRIYSLVTKTIVEKMKIDILRRNIPFESASNKKMDCSSICNAKGEAIALTDKQSDDLNGIGIATAKFVGGGWRTWGVCMANYYYLNDDNILPEQQNDVAVQMLDFICNDFQEVFVDSVDKPINSRMAKAIVDDYQVIMNGYVSLGALLYGGISFNRKSNTVKDLTKGDFIFDIVETSTPPGKSLTARVQYTIDGIENLFSGGGN